MRSFFSFCNFELSISSLQPKESYDLGQAVNTFPAL